MSQRYFTEKKLERLVKKASRLQDRRGKYSEEDARRTLEDPAYGFTQDTIDEVLGEKYSGKRVRVVNRKKPEKLERGLYLEVIKEGNSKARRVLGDVAKGFLSGLFAIPTGIRKWNGESSNIEANSYLIGWVANAIHITSLIINRDSIPENYKEVLPYVFGAQIITNLASGIQEHLLHVKKKARERRGDFLESD